MKPFTSAPLAGAPFYLISAGDTVRLAPLSGPGDGVAHSVFLEVWEPGGAQPPNSHAESVETFLFLRGSGEAEVDGVRTRVGAGQFLTLAPGTVHRIVNTGAGRLYAITTMSPDHGFHKLVTDGVPLPADPEDAAAVAALFPAA